jgi:hypothetical protein
MKSSCPELRRSKNSGGTVVLEYSPIVREDYKSNIGTVDEHDLYYQIIDRVLASNKKRRLQHKQKRVPGTLDR